MATSFATRLTGPKLDKLVQRLKDKYAYERQKAIKALEAGYPYGAIRLTPDEQVLNFIKMQPQDYEALVMKLNDRYRGLPNAFELVNRDLAQFMRRMITLMLSKGQVSEADYTAQADQIYNDVGNVPSNNKVGGLYNG